MASFLSRAANEASAALADAYGHVVHGDDAGAAARLVWVVHPVQVPLDASPPSAGGTEGDEGGGGPGGAGAGAGPSSPGRAGASSYLFTQKFDLGLTFLEINDRAYVRTVDADSLAEKAGIQPQDCVQFACVAGGPLFDDLQMQSSTPSPQNNRRNNSNRRKAERENERQRLDAQATKFVLECEKRGMRTSYDELRELFAGCTLPPKEGGLMNEKETIALPRTPNSKQRANDDDFTIGSNSLMLADSVGGMFERSKKDGRNVSSRRVPLPDKKIAKNVTLNVTNAARTAAGRCFDANAVADGDDNEFFADNRYPSPKKMSPAFNIPASPIKSNNAASASSSSPLRVGGTYGDSVVEQSLWPVVLVLRRTVQRRRTLGPGWLGPGLSLRGALFGIPSFRMDDECDRAAALVRQLAPGRGTAGGAGDGGAPPASPPRGGDGGVQTPMAAAGPGRAAGGEDVEASTVRGVIRHAVGLCFVRLSKVVVGVSLQGGSGVVIARLADGTWSAPAAVGVYGLGVGLQFGLEVADFVFAIQTQEGMEHFKRGGNFAVGGNIGAAVAAYGREAYGAASLGACTGPMPLDEPPGREDADDGASDCDESTYRSDASSARSRQPKKKDNDIAPMVAYAKSQGLYFGVSVDGLKFFTRNDINARTYKFSMLGELPANDILSGLVTPPPEAEELYAALHSVEYTHEATELPRPPEMLRKDSMNDWRFDRSIAATEGEIADGTDGNPGNSPLYSFLPTLDGEEAEQFARFETKFKKFLYGGVPVQHLMPHAAPTRSGMTRREKRTLWLMLPEVGSLRLGFVSKAKDGGETAMDDITVASSVASSRADADDQTVLVDGRTNVKLSKKYSVSLTDITILSQDPNVTIRLSPDDATEHLRVLSIHDVTGKSMLLLANSKGEAELLFCGLKLLLECETSRLSVRGGVPLNKLGGKLGKTALTPEMARGSSKSRSLRRERSENSKSRHIPRGLKHDLDDRSKYSSFGEPGTDSDESGTKDDKNPRFNEKSEIAKLSDRHQVPEGRQSWSQLPGRNYMNQMASNSANPRAQMQAPTYELGKVIYTDIATNISLPLPLALCRVLFLDSSSPVNKSWESGRADSNYHHGSWSFPPGSVREFDRNKYSEQQLISSGKMAGAQRTISYSRTRNRELVRLSETMIVEKDDEHTLVLVVVDQMPRRGFSARARLHLRSFGNQTCEARVVTEIRPVGKNLSNQQAVHKAYILVLDEMKKRYGVEEKGLLAVFLDVYNTLPGHSNPSSTLNNSVSLRSQAGYPSPNSKSQPSMTSFEDVLPGDKGETPSTASRQLPGNGSSANGNNPRLNGARAFTQQSPRRPRKDPPERPSTPSMQRIDSKTLGMPHESQPQQNIAAKTDDFADFTNFDDIPRNPVTVEVKPLPKMRLDLCPVPREEDEEEESSVSVSDAKQKKKSRHSKRHRRRSHR